MPIKKDAVDMQLHMAVKASAILQGEINCKLDQLVKKAKLLQEKEANHLLEMISDNLNEVVDLFGRRKNLRNQIENMKRIEKDLMKE